METNLSHPLPEWFLLRQGPNPPDYNMALDEALMRAAPHLGRPILRFYGWSEPAATFGYSQHYAEIERLTLLRPLVRRPTGGGLVPHDHDWTYSIVCPPDDPWYALKAAESYRRVHQWISDAFARLNILTTLAAEPKKDAPGQCFIGAEKDDVLWFGRKIAGAAQRRTRTGLLIQGSVQPPPIPVERRDWEEALCQSQLVHWVPFKVAEDLQRTCSSSKYRDDNFNRKR